MNITFIIFSILKSNSAKTNRPTHALLHGTDLIFKSPFSKRHESYYKNIKKKQFRNIKTRF